MNTFWKLIDRAVSGIFYGLGGALGIWIATKMVSIEIVISIGGQ